MKLDRLVGISMSFCANGASHLEAAILLSDLVRASIMFDHFRHEKEGDGAEKRAHWFGQYQSSLNAAKRLFQEALKNKANPKPPKAA